MCTKQYWCTRVGPSWAACTNCIINVSPLCMCDVYSCNIQCTHSCLINLPCAWHTLKSVSILHFALTVAELLWLLVFQRDTLSPLDNWSVLMYMCDLLYVYTQQGRSMFHKIAIVHDVRLTWCIYIPTRYKWICKITPDPLCRCKGVAIQDQPSSGLSLVVCTLGRLLNRPGSAPDFTELQFYFKDTGRQQVVLFLDPGRVEKDGGRTNGL